jgi:hypothetical protein
MFWTVEDGRVEDHGPIVISAANRTESMSLGRRAEVKFQIQAESNGVFHTSTPDED